MQTICYDRMNLCSKDDVPYNDILRFIGKQKNAMLSTTDELIYSDDDPFSKNNMKEIFVSYEKFKEENRYIEFDDFLNLANEALDEDENTYNYYSNCFKYVLSDEFQDISKSQSLLLKKLNTKNTMIVGDPLQAIYSFRGGNSKYILDFEKGLFEYIDTKYPEVPQDIRTTGEISEATEKVLVRAIEEFKAEFKK